MKKIFLLSLLFMFLISCGKEEKKAEPKEETQVEINSDSKENTEEVTVKSETDDESADVSVEVDEENVSVKAGNVKIDSKDGTVEAPGVEIKNGKVKAPGVEIDIDTKSE